MKPKYMLNEMVLLTILYILIELNQERQFQMKRCERNEKR